MEYFEIFAETVSQHISCVNPYDLVYHYAIFKRSNLLNENASNDLVQRISAYIYDHMPEEHQVNISEIMSDIKHEDVILWLKEESVPFNYTLIGIYIDEAYVETVLELLTLSPIELEFKKICVAYKLDVTEKEFINFKTRLPKKIVHKCSYHPLYKKFTEFFFQKDLDQLIILINRWCALITADLPSNSDGFLSLGEAARLLKISSEDFFDWLNANYSSTDVYRATNGKVDVNTDFLINILDLKSNSEPLADLISVLINDASVVSSLRKKLKSYVTKEINSLKPAWLIQGRKIPGLGSNAHFNRNMMEQVKSDVHQIIDYFPFRSLSELRAITGLTLPKLKSLADNSHIKATCFGTSYYVSPIEVRKIKDFCDSNIAFDTLFEEIADTDTFDHNSKRHQGALIDYLTGSHLNEKIFRDDGTIPMNCMYHGLYINKDFKPKLIRWCSLWALAYKKPFEEKISTTVNYISADYPHLAFALNNYNMHMVQLTQKSLHKLELDDLNCSERAKIATQRRGYQKIRREPKHIIKEHAKPVYEMILTLVNCLDELGKDISQLNENEIELYLVSAFARVTTISATIFADFIYTEGFTQKKYTFGKSGYQLEASAYTRDQFAYLIAGVVSEEFWLENNLINKAVNEPRFASLWLYVALHVLAAWRTTDLIRLPFPYLPYDDEITLKMISDNNYSDQDAYLVADLYIARVLRMQMTPNKTRKYANVSPLYFHCPESCKVPFGIILSIAAAHRGKLATKDANVKFVEKVNDITLIRRFFGLEFANACGNRNFSGRRANKSLMQAIDYEARQQGYSPYIAFTMASDVRSHKYSYRGPLSNVTRVYLEDGKFSGYSEQYIIEQMFERGIMSFIVNNLMSLSYGDKYKTLSIEKQTKLIKSLEIDGYQLDNVIQCALDAEASAVNALKTVFSQSEEKSAKKILAKIVDGDAEAKENGVYCLCKAADVKCLFPHRLKCFGCIYEIKSKDILLYYVHNYDEMKKIINDKDNRYSQHEKDKAKWLIDHVLIPGLIEIKACLAAVSTEEELKVYSRIIKERNKQFNECPTYIDY